MIAHARRRSRAFPLLVLAALVSLSGCESRRAAERRAEQAEAATALLGHRPEALMVRFRASKGAGFSREGWELEILQLGGEVRLEGSVRSGTQTGPVSGQLPPADYAELWSWLSGLPLQGFRVQQDSSAADDGWTKSLDVDIVLDANRRIKSSNRWTRRTMGAPWLDELEERLHRIALAHRVGTDTSRARPDSTRDAIDKAVRAAREDLDGTTHRDAANTP